MMFYIWLPQFLYLKTNPIDLPKKKKITVYFIYIFTLTTSNSTNKYSRVFLFSLFLFDSIVFPEPSRNRDSKTVIQTEPWNSWTVSPLLGSHSNESNNYRLKLPQLNM